MMEPLVQQPSIGDARGLKKQLLSSTVLVFLDVSFWNSVRKIIQTEFQNSVFIVSDILTQKCSLLESDGDSVRLVRFLSMPPATRFGVAKIVRHLVLGPVFFISMTVSEIRRNNSKFQV